jgi:hypothetical protein
VQIDRPAQGHLQTTKLNSLLSRVFEILPQGVVVVCSDLKPRYWNSKAQDFCSQQLGISLSDRGLPFPITESCYRLMRESDAVSSIVVEYGAPDGSVMRISVRWLDATMVSLPVDQDSKAGASRSFMVVFLENCDQIMQKEVFLQKKKYDLTDREAEILMLMRKEYTYQEIAQMLQISLNTVKTHVKNVYAKQRTWQGKEKFWFYE